MTGPSGAIKEQQPKTGQTLGTLEPNLLGRGEVLEQPTGTAAPTTHISLAGKLDNLVFPSPRENKHVIHIHLLK